MRNIAILIICFFSFGTYADRARFYPNYCIKAEVISVKPILNELYKTRVVQYGENDIYEFNYDKKLNSGDVKYFLIGTNQDKNQKTEIRLFDNHKDCYHMKDFKYEDWFQLLKSKCINSSATCFEQYGFYRVKSFGNKRIYKNDLSQYIEVTLDREISDPLPQTYDGINIDIQDKTGQLDIEYRPSANPCFYLQAHRNFIDFSDYVTWVKCKIFNYE